jgi:hypothetical protein
MTSIEDLNSFDIRLQCWDSLRWNLLLTREGQKRNGVALA